MSDTTRTARCVCGALTVTTTGEPDRVLTCSCLDCRRKSGSAFSVSTYWPPDQVTIQGDTKGYRRDAQDGRGLELRFCPTCGVSVYWLADFARGQIGIGGGNFEDCNFAVPTEAYWTEGRADWVHHLSDIPALQRQ